MGQVKLSPGRAADPKGTFVARRRLTVTEAVDDFIAARHNLRATSLSKLTYDLDVLKQFYGDMNLQQLTKAHIDRMVRQLVEGGMTTPPTTKFPKGRIRKPWGPKAVNKVIAATARLLEDAHRQGFVPRNVAASVARVASSHQSLDTFTHVEVQQLLSGLKGDLLAHAWYLALSGLRRGEVAGLRWSDIDFDSGTLTITNNRVSAGGRAVENDPKSRSCRGARFRSQNVSLWLSVMRTSVNVTNASRPALRTAQAPMSSPTKSVTRTRPPCCPGTGVTRSLVWGCDT